MASARTIEIAKGGVMSRHWKVLPLAVLLSSIGPLDAEPARSVRFGLAANALQVEGDDLTLTIRATQQFDCSLFPRDARGNEAAIEGIPVWVSSDVTLLQITPAPDGMTAHAVAVGPLGLVTLTVTADGKIGEGTRDITGILEVNILAGEAVGLEVVPAPPFEQAMQP